MSAVDNSASPYGARSAADTPSIETAEPADVEAAAAAAATAVSTEGRASGAQAFGGEEPFGGPEADGAGDVEGGLSEAAFEASLFLAGAGGAAD